MKQVKCTKLTDSISLDWTVRAIAAICSLLEFSSDSVGIFDPNYVLSEIMILNHIDSSDALD